VRESRAREISENVEKKSPCLIVRRPGCFFHQSTRLRRDMKSQSNRGLARYGLEPRFRLERSHVGPLRSCSEAWRLRSEPVRSHFELLRLHFEPSRSHFELLRLHFEPSRSHLEPSRSHLESLRSLFFSLRSRFELLKQRLHTFKPSVFSRLRGPLDSKAFVKQFR